MKFENIPSISDLVKQASKRPMKQITIICSEQAAEELAPLLEECKTLGAVGASRSIKIEDWDGESNFGFDGDGSSFIDSIKVEEHRDKESKELTTKDRNNLPSSDFVFPEEEKYPIPDKSHAQNALARVEQHGTPEEKAKVRSKVKKKYPDMDVEGKK